MRKQRDSGTTIEKAHSFQKLQSIVLRSLLIAYYVYKVALAIESFILLR